MEVVGSYVSMVTGVRLDVAERRLLITEALERVGKGWRTGDTHRHTLSWVREFANLQGATASIKNIHHLRFIITGRI